MNQYIFIIAFAVIGLTFIINQIFYSKKAKFKRKLKKIPLKPIGDFKDGHAARLVGQAVAVGETLRAPLTGRACLYYEVEVEQEKSSGKNSSWQTIISDAQHVPFGVKDEHDLALITDQNIKGLIVVDSQFKSGFLNDPAVGLKQFLKHHGQDSENLIGLNKTLRYKEGIIEPNERVTVYGQGHWTKEHVEEYNLPDTYYLHITPTAEDPIYLSDDIDMIKLPYKPPKQSQYKQKRYKQAEGHYMR